LEIVAKFAFFLETPAHTHISKSDNYSKVSGYLKLTKFRLGSLVVFSAIITYFTVVETIDWIQVLALSLGGFFVTSAANGFNQIIEKDLDHLMERTKMRPMPRNVGIAIQIES